MSEQPKVREDIKIECTDVTHPEENSKIFIFKAGEQEFFEKNNLYPPKRCPMCRMRRKQNGTTKS